MQVSEGNGVAENAAASQDLNQDNHLQNCDVEVQSHMPVESPESISKKHSLSIQESLIGLQELVEKANSSIHEKVKAISHLSDHKTVALSEQFQNLAKNASLQAKYLNDLITIAQKVKVGDETISIQEISSLLQKTFLESITNMMEISKQAMLMVYILTDGVQNLRDIEKSIRQIEVINHKTKYLSINATIEAVRAGEAGESFQVVASEVRDLSNDTQRLAVSIRSQVNQMTETLHYAQDLLQKVASIDMSGNIMAKDRLDEMMSGLIDNSEKISHIIGDASRASQEFAESARQLITDIQYQDRVRQDLEQIDQTVNSIHKVSDSIKNATQVENPILINLEKLKLKLPEEISQPINTILTPKPPFSAGMEAEKTSSSEDIELF